MISTRHSETPQTVVHALVGEASAGKGEGVIRVDLMADGRSPLLHNHSVPGITQARQTRRREFDMLTFLPIALLTFNS